MFMENLEETTMDKSPSTMKPKILKWYIDDPFEMFNKSQRDALTEHLKSIDVIVSIKFTNELEMNDTTKDKIFNGHTGEYGGSVPDPLQSLV